MALDRDLKREALAARAGPARRAVPKQEEKVARTDPRLLHEDGLGSAFNDKAQDAHARRDDESEGEGRQLRESWDEAQKQDKLNRPGFPRGLFVQNSGGFFKSIHLCMEFVLQFLRRPMAIGAV